MNIWPSIWVNWKLYTIKFIVLLGVIMELFNQVNLKQFETLKYIMNNVQDDHIMCKINCELRTDNFTHITHKIKIL